MLHAIGAQAVQNAAQAIQNAAQAIRAMQNAAQANEWYTDGPAPPWVPYSERYKDLPTGHTAIAWHESDCQLLIRPWRLLPPVVSNYWHREKRRRPRGARP